MSQRLTINYENKPCYDIVFSNTFTDLTQEFNALSLEERRICIVTDTNVAALYGVEIEMIVSAACKKAVTYTFTAGEEHKTLETVQNAYTFLIEEGFDRKDMLIALGGGVVGDLTGFIAATYLRGISFLQIPTTLLAQVDSSIGGKTGVDFNGYKNMVGAFHMPSLVYINMSTLQSLDARQFSSGFAEIMKHGLIKDRALYEWLLEHIYEIDAREQTVLAQMVMRSCNVKKDIVENDPKEQGERALLNFGHTIGHAIEKAKKFTLTHGECVALGCVAAAHISWKHELISMEEYYEVRDMFVPFGLPISVENIDASEILTLTKSDKKMAGGCILFLLLEQVGKAVIDRTVTDEDIVNAVREITYSEDMTA